MPPRKAPEAGEQPAKKRERAPRLSQQQVVAIYAAQGGKCYILGTPLVGDEWSISDGKAISSEGRRLKGSRTWDELRKHILGRIGDEAAEVEALGIDLQVAKERQASTLKGFAGLLASGAEGRPAGVVFAGERTNKEAEVPEPAASADSKAAGGDAATGAGG